MANCIVGWMLMRAATNDEPHRGVMMMVFCWLWCSYVSERRGDESIALTAKSTDVKLTVLPSTDPRPRGGTACHLPCLSLNLAGGLKVNLLRQWCTESGPTVVFVWCRRHVQMSYLLNAVSGPTLWNSLPLSVRDPSLTLTQFCVRLKTVLFCRAYETLA